MSNTSPSSTPPTGPQLAADLQDERLIHGEGLGGAITSAWMNIRTGNLGSLPVIVGLVIIWAVFEILNPVFLSPSNLVNLALESVPVGVISLGIVLVLLLGEIDLSVGSVSGVASAILGVGMMNWHWPIILAILLAVGVGAAIGLLYGVLFTRFGVPSFVITLAGLLAILGVQLWVLGPTGTINLPYSSWIVQFENNFFLYPWVVYVLALIAALSVLFSDLAKARRRRRAGLSASPASLALIKAIALAVVLGFVGWYLARDFGTGISFVFLVVLVVLFHFLLTRTKWGRSIFAVGGNVEAARRSGIKVNFVYISVFMSCSALAVIGGILSAARLSGASQSAGTGDVNLDAIAAAVIGGTSLFGGRGSAWSALLGIVVIQSISNGLTLLNLNSDVRYIITGAVLLVAVIVDSLSRRSRASHGQA